MKHTRRFKLTVVFVVLAAVIVIVIGVTLGCLLPGNRETMQYVVNFLDYNGNILKTCMVEEGEVPVYEGELCREATQSTEYGFVGWESEGELYTQLPAIDHNRIFTAQYEAHAREYTVTFSVGQEKVERNYVYGAMPAYEDETVTVDGCVYEIVGWDRSFCPVTSETTYTAVLEMKRVLITFVVDGESLTSEVPLNASPQFYGIPYRDGTKAYDYRFIGWRTQTDRYDAADLPPATKTETYYAEFEEVPKKFHVTFCDYRQETLDSNTVVYGEMASYGGEDTAEIGGLPYTIVGWELDGVEYYGTLPAVTADSVFTAIYERINSVNRLTIHYCLNGETVSEYIEDLTYGDDYYVVTPLRSGYAADKSYVRGALVEDTELTVNYLTTSVWDGSVSAFTEGDGTQLSPYLISEASQLAYLAQQTAAGTTYADTYFALNNTLDLNHLPWKAIGSYTYPFAGYFDGRNHAIVNLSYDNALSNSNLANSGHGLFSTVSGTVKNLTVSGSVRSLARYTGLVVGSNRGSVEHCAALGVSSGYGNVGGVVGYNVGTVADCVNYATVSDIDSANCYRFGGVVGTTEGNVSGCKNYGEVRIDAGTGTVGGVVGHSSSSAILTECWNYAYVFYEKNVSSSMTYTGGVVGYSTGLRVESCQNYAPVLGSDRVGGVVGWTNSTEIAACVNYGYVCSGLYAGGIVSVSRGSVSDCVNYGTVRCNGNYCGGIASYAGSVVESCVNYGEVQATGSSVGGIVGQLKVNGADAIIRLCENYGMVSTTSAATNVVTGGIAGRADSETVKDCFARIEQCTNYGKVKAGGAYVGGVVGACNGAAVKDCMQFATVDGGIGFYVGGIAGSNYGYGSVQGCTNSGTILGATSVGQICGQLTSTSTASGNVENGKTIAN